MTKNVDNLAFTKLIVYSVGKLKTNSDLSFVNNILI